MQAYSTVMRIGNSEVLMKIFGRWPSFHDAEVIALRLDRMAGEGGTPSLEMDVELWEMTGDVDPQGFYVRLHGTLATLRFDDIDQVELAGFNGQNVIADFTIEEGEPDRLVVNLATSYGVSAAFTCATATVLRAESISSDRGSTGSFSAG